FATRLAASVTFSGVLEDPKLNRIEFVVRSLFSPYMAESTWEGSTDPAVHALPLDAAILSKSKLVSNDSTLVPGKLRLTIVATPCSGLPFTLYAIPFSDSCLINCSL